MVVFIRSLYWPTILNRQPNAVLGIISENYAVAIHQCRHMDNKAAIERHKMMPHLREACINCKMCELGWRKAKRDSYEYDPHVFYGHDPTYSPPRFMIVGQNPGWNEVKQGKPFVGQSGANFDKELNSTTNGVIMWRRDVDFYITNVVKCFTEGNKPPTPKQVGRCEPFLRMEIAIIKPKLVIAFGGVAFGALCKEKYSERIGKITASEKFGVKVFTTYHPSPLNLADPARRKRFSRDIKTICRIMDYYLTPF